MSLASDPLPTDPQALRQFAESLQAELARKEIEIAANAAEIYAKTLHIEQLKAQLAVLRRARFGRSSEKLDREIEQLELLIGDLEEGAAEAQARATTNQHTQTNADPPAQPPRERRHPTRTPLPAHLPRETITHEPACTCPGCGGSLFSRIGQDEREVLEYVPSSFKVIRHIRPKLSCRACETIVQAPMPSLPIERGRPGPGLLAHVAVAKFADHIPLHRQATMYAREGVELDRATLADWVGQAVFLLAPLAEAIGRHVLSGAVLHADDTTVPVLAPGLGRTRTGRLWVVVRDGLGVLVYRPPRSIATRRTARRSMLRHCSLPAEASCTPMATLASANSTGHRGLATTHRWSRWPAGAMCAANSMTCTTPLPRQRRSRPCSGSPPCSPLRAASGANHRSAAWLCASNTPVRCSTS
jgi:transposase